MVFEFVQARDLFAQSLQGEVGLIGRDHDPDRIRSSHGLTAQFKRAGWVAAGSQCQGGGRSERGSAVV